MAHIRLLINKNLLFLQNIYCECQTCGIQNDQIDFIRLKDLRQFFQYFQFCFTEILAIINEDGNVHIAKRFRRTSGKTAEKIGKNNLWLSIQTILGRMN